MEQVELSQNETHAQAIIAPLLALLPSLSLDLCLAATLDTPTVVMSWPMPTEELTNRECMPQ